MDPRDLLSIAHELAGGLVGGRRGRPRQTELRRALSAAYHAMFHTLASFCANQLAGSTPVRRRSPAWVQAYRALEHGRARDRLMNSSGMSQFPDEYRDFGQQFVNMQDVRHSADYDPTARFLRLHVNQVIEETSRKMDLFNTVPNAEKRAFALYVLLRSR